MESTKKRSNTKKNTPEKNLEAMLLAKKKMEEKDFHTSTLSFGLRFTRWNDLRVYLIEKNFIEKQHITYTWIGGEPTIEMGQEFVEFYRKRCDENRKPKIKAVAEKLEVNDIYTDIFILKKRNQELMAQNGKLYQELKDNTEQRKAVVEKFFDFINSDKVSQFKRRLHDFENELHKFDYEQIEKTRKSFAQKTQLSKEEKAEIVKVLLEISQGIRSFPPSYIGFNNGRTKFEDLEIAMSSEVYKLKKENEKLKLEANKTNQPESSTKEELKKISELADYRLNQIKGLKDLIRENKESFKLKEKDLLNTLHCSSEIRKRLEDKLNSLSAKEKSEETISLLGVKIYQKKIT